MNVSENCSLKCPVLGNIRDKAFLKPGSCEVKQKGRKSRYRVPIYVPSYFSVCCRQTMPITSIIHHTLYQSDPRTAKDSSSSRKQFPLELLCTSKYYVVIDIEYDSTENEVSLALCFSAARERGSITVVWKKRS
jgi:hypothetical protein